MSETIVMILKLMWLGADSTLLRVKLVFSFLFGFLNGILLFLFPLMLSSLVKAINVGNKADILFYFYALAGISCSIFLCRFVWRYWIECISTIIPLHLKQNYFKRIFNKPYEWHLHNSVGYFSTALERVCSNIHTWLWKSPYDYVASFSLCCCFFIYAYLISPWLLLYFLIGLIIMGIMIRLLYEKRLKYIAAFTKSNLKFSKTFIDFLYNIRSVKKMNLLSFAHKNISEKIEEVTCRNIEMMRYNAIQWGFMEAFVSIVFLLPVGYYIYQFLKTGAGIEVIVMIVAVQPYMDQMGRHFMGFMYEAALAQTEARVLSEHLGTSVEEEIDSHFFSKWHKIIFNNTFFKFEKEGHVFEHRIHSFEIHKGDHIAVTGHSGEGKSTFLNLLTRQFLPESGDILVDTVHYRDVPAAFWDENMVYISQDVELFDMSLYDNLVMGKKISKEKLQKIIDGCCLNELVERMDGNMHTDIGEKGVKVSAGEKQRINLARGLLLNREILVLDEITANLDPYTTQKIWQFIFKEYVSKTIIAVSHEPELLKHVGRFFCFKRGRGKEIQSLENIENKG